MAERSSERCSSPDVTLDIKVVPGAKRNAWKEEEGRVKVYLTAPAVDGKANKALVEFLAGRFHVRPRQVEVIKGLKSRQKTITIKGLSGI